MPSGWRAMAEFTNGCGEMVEALEFTAMERATELRGGNWKIWMWESETDLPLQANETSRQESLHSFFPLLQIPWKLGSSLTTNERGGRFIQILCLSIESWPGVLPCDVPAFSKQYRTNRSPILSNSVEEPGNSSQPAAKAVEAAGTKADEARASFGLFWSHSMLESVAAAHLRTRQKTIKWRRQLEVTTFVDGFDCHLTGDDG